jgi:ABC-type branched-subunit amino acid transport system ATPase component
MIEAVALTKRYGDVTAVDGLSFTVPAGSVTGFLGPKGSGKSTTMRMVTGLDAPTPGSVTVDGRPYAGYRRPLRAVGALLDAKALDGGRSAFNHLRWPALSNGIPRSRVDEVLRQVGLASAAGKRVGGFSPGMAQRLGIAAGLLGVLSVPPLPLDLLPGTWKTTVGPYIPMQPGGQIYAAHREAASLAPWTGFGVFCLYAAVALLAGFAAVNRRDA